MADLVVSSDIDSFMAAANQAAMRTALGLGSISTQSASAVVITGGTLSGITSLTCTGLVTISGAIIGSVNGAASTPALLGSGTIFTGGTATTTKPYWLIEPTGTTSNNWSTDGTILGLNAPSGFGGNIVDGQRNGLSGFRVNLNASGNAILRLGTRGTYISSQDDYAFEAQGYFGQLWKQNSAGLTVFGRASEIATNNGTLAFYNGTPTAKPTVSGSRGGNAALDSLCAALATLNLIANSTSA